MNNHDPAWDSGGELLTGTAAAAHRDGDSMEAALATLRRVSAARRTSPGALLTHLLSAFAPRFFVGLPDELLAHIMDFLDYSTASCVAAAVCRLWRAVFRGESPREVSRAERGAGAGAEAAVTPTAAEAPPSPLFTRRRQMHGVHQLHPGKGIYYYPRTLRSHARSVGAGDQRRLHVATAGERVGAANGLSQLFLRTEVRTHAAQRSPIWEPLHVLSAPRPSDPDGPCAASAAAAATLTSSASPASRLLTLSAVAVLGRRLYIFGGEMPADTVSGGAACYDPDTKTAVPLPPLPPHRAAGKSGGAGGGGSGGNDGASSDSERSGDSEEEVMLGEEAWAARRRALLAGGRAGAAAVAAPDGNIFVFGGYRRGGRVLDTYAVFNAHTGLWEEEEVEGEEEPLTSEARSAARRMPAPACGLAGTLVEGHYVLLAGGYGRGPAGGTSNESRRNDVPRMTVSGPSSEDGCRDTLWVFDTRARLWHVSSARLPSPRCFGAAVALPVGGELAVVYVGGGAGDSTLTPRYDMLYLPVRAVLAELQGEKGAEAVASPSAPPLQWATLGKSVVGGALVSAAVVGLPADPTLVLQGFWPRSLMAFCKWNAVAAVRSPSPSSFSPPGVHPLQLWETVDSGETRLRSFRTASIDDGAVPREHWISQKANGRIIVGIE